MCKQKTVVFDVCDTLFYSNTSFEFLEYVFKNNKVKSLYLTLYTAKWSIIFIFGVLLSKVIKRDIIRSWSLSLLEGYPKKVLFNYAEDFVTSQLCSKKVKATNKKLQELKQNHKVLILSASIDPVIDTISAQYGVKCFSSVLEYSGGICTGKLNIDLTGRKLNMLNEQDLSELLVFSDNYSDLELMLKAKEAYAVVHNKKQEQFWSINGIKILRVG